MHNVTKINKKKQTNIKIPNDLTFLVLVYWFVTIAFYCMYMCMNFVHSCV